MAAVIGNREIESSGEEEGIVASVVDGEVRGWCELVCLLFSIRIFDFLQSQDFMGDPIASNQPKSVASRVKEEWPFCGIVCPRALAGSCC